MGASGSYIERAKDLVPDGVSFHVRRGDVFSPLHRVEMCFRAKEPFVIYGLDRENPLVTFATVNNQYIVIVY